MIDNTEETAAWGDRYNTNRDYEIERMIFLVGVLPLIIFGLFGNILTFIVMRTGSLKDVSTCFYMSILALADTGEFIVLLNTGSG